MISTSLRAVVCAAIAPGMFLVLSALATSCSGSGPEIEKHTGCEIVRIKSDTTVDDESLKNKFVYVSPEAVLTLGENAVLDNTYIVSSSSTDRASVVLGGKISASGFTIMFDFLNLTGNMTLTGDPAELTVKNCFISGNCSIDGSESYPAAVTLTDNFIAAAATDAFLKLNQAFYLYIERNFLYGGTGTSSGTGTYTLCTIASEPYDKVVCTSNTAYPQAEFYPYTTPTKTATSYAWPSDPVATLDTTTGAYSFSDLLLGAVTDMQGTWTRTDNAITLSHCPTIDAVTCITMPNVSVAITEANDGGCDPQPAGVYKVTATCGAGSRTYTLYLPDIVTDDYGTWQLQWSDEFKGDDWDREAWSRCPKQTSDWNRCQEPDDESLVMVENGALELLAKRYPDVTKGRDGYATGGIWGLDKVAFNLGNGITSGRIDVCARMSDAQGYWPAIWMMPQQEGYSWPQWGEIDLMEHLNYSSSYYATLHTWQDGALNKGTYTDYSEGNIGNFTDRLDWHVFSVIVDSEKIVLAKDGLAIVTCRQADHNVTDDDFMELRRDYWPYDATDYYLILDSQVGGSWVGNPKPAAYETPAHMDIDYVRYMILP